MQGNQVAIQLFTEPQLLEAASAAEHGDRAKLDALKRSGLDINQAGAKDGSTLLVWAVLSQDPKAAKLLLSEGADPNRIPKDTSPALGWAVRLEDQTLMKLLLEAGANPNLYSNRKETAIFEAESSGRWENVRYLLDHGANIDAIDGKTGETLAIQLMGGSEVHVLELLQRGANYTHLDYGGMSVAHGLKYRYVNPTLSPATEAREKIRAFLVAHNVNLDIPKYGPPPRDQWPADQKDDPKLIEAQRFAAQYPNLK